MLGSTFKQMFLLPFFVCIPQIKKKWFATNWGLKKTEGKFAKMLPKLLENLCVGVGMLYHFLGEYSRLCGWPFLLKMGMQVGFFPRIILLTSAVCSCCYSAVETTEAHSGPYAIYFILPSMCYIIQLNCALVYCIGFRIWRLCLLNAIPAAI